MIIKDEEALKRLNSPLNLINKLRSSSGNNGNNGRKSAMSLFGIGRKKLEEVMPSVSVQVGTTEKTGGPHPVNNTQSFNPFQAASVQLAISSIAIPIAAAAEKPQQASSLSNILENHESQIKLGLAHDNALELMNNSIKKLSEKLDEVKADKLPSVISAASKTVESIRRERNEAAKNEKDREVHYHFYTPSQHKIEDYGEVIEVTAESR